MNKKIKVIELFNRINENKNIPEKIKYHDIEYKYDEDMQEYYACKEGRTTYFFYNVVEHKWAWLDTEVEILEDEEEIDIQAIKENKELVEWPPVGTYSVENLNAVARRTYGFLKEIMYTQNDLIRSVKQLDKKINKED